MPASATSGTWRQSKNPVATGCDDVFLPNISAALYSSVPAPASTDSYHSGRCNTALRPPNPLQRQTHAQAQSPTQAGNSTLSASTQRPQQGHSKAYTVICGESIISESTPKLSSRESQPVEIDTPPLDPLAPLLEPESTSAARAPGASLSHTCRAATSSNGKSPLLSGQCGPLNFTGVQSRNTSSTAATAAAPSAVAQPAPIKGNKGRTATMDAGKLQRQLGALQLLLGIEQLPFQRASSGVYFPPCEPFRSPVRGLMPHTPGTHTACYTSHHPTCMHVQAHSPLYRWPPPLLSSRS